MSEQQALPIGTIVRSGSHVYRIERILGQGGFGITYMASYQDSGSGVPVYVALKEFFMKEVNGRSGTSVTTGSEDGLFGSHRRKFAREANNLRKLNHPNIIRVMDYFELNNTSYYAMEYLDGGSLDQYIQKYGAVKEDVAIRMVRQVGAALSYVHSQGILHLDLKPGNIMLRHDGSVVLIDFGLSKQYDAGGSPESSTTIKAWTEGYAPMEQTASHGMKGFPITIDVYALGATLYKMVTGMTPPSAFAIYNDDVRLKDALTSKGVNPNTIAAIEKAMAPKKADRFQSVNDFMRRLMTAEEIRTALHNGASITTTQVQPKAAKSQPPKSEDTVIEKSKPSIAATHTSSSKTTTAQSKLHNNTTSTQVTSFGKRIWKCFFIFIFGLFLSCGAGFAMKEFGPLQDIVLDGRYDYFFNENFWHNTQIIILLIFQIFLVICFQITADFMLIWGIEKLVWGDDDSEITFPALAVIGGVLVPIAVGVVLYTQFQVNPELGVPIGDFLFSVIYTIVLLIYIYV